MSALAGALAGALAVSDRTLTRRFAAAVGTTPLGYLQELRLDAVRALLEAGDQGMQAVAMQVGYSDASFFTRLFRQGCGLSQGAHRRRFRLAPAGSAGGGWLL